METPSGRAEAPVRVRSTDWQCSRYLADVLFDDASLPAPASSRLVVEGVGTSVLYVEVMDRSPTQNPDRRCWAGNTPPRPRWRACFDGLTEEVRLVGFTEMVGAARHPRGVIVNRRLGWWWFGV